MKPVFDPLEIFRSVETIWFLWGFSILVTVVLTVATAQRLKCCILSRMWRCEGGGAYSLGYVMVVPFYVLFVCLVVETTHILVVKIGTVYAAYSGARCACVWDSATSPANATFRADHAARQAIVPFSNGTGPKRSRSVITTPLHHREYMRAYKRFVDETAPETFILAKYAYAEEHFHTTYQRPQEWDDDVRFHVTFDFRFHLPAVAQALGVRGEDGNYYMPIRSSVDLQSEAPQNEQQRLGISYATPK